MKLAVFASALVLAATGAAAAQPAEETAPAEQTAASTTTSTNAQATEQQDENKKICRTERATGSLTRRTRICMTAAQWRETNARTYRGVSEMQSQAAGGTNSSFSSQGSGQ